MSVVPGADRCDVNETSKKDEHEREHVKVALRMELVARTLRPL